MESWRRGVGDIPSRTLMRTPFVKRQTPPQSGFFAFFPLSRASRSRQSVTCPDVISVRRCPPMWLHHTRIEALSPSPASAEKSLEGTLRPRNNAVPSYRPSMLPLLSSPRRIFSPLHSLDTVSHRPDRSGGFPWRWDPSVSNDLLSVWALTPITRFSIRLSTRAGRPG